jgi:hypothetical protein
MQRLYFFRTFVFRAWTLFRSDLIKQVGPQLNNEEAEKKGIREGMVNYTLK